MFQKFLDGLAAEMAQRKGGDTQFVKVRGELTKQTSETIASREIKHEAAAPPFIPDKQRPHEHPYYWTPFILIGNWK